MFEEGKDPPHAFFNRPEVDEVNALYWEGFHILSTERQIGMAAGPIPASKIEKYAVDLGLASDEIDIFDRVIRNIDSAYLSESSPETRPGKQQLRDEVPASDTAGVFRILKNLARKPKTKS